MYPKYSLSSLRSFNFILERPSWSLHPAQSCVAQNKAGTWELVLTCTDVDRVMWAKRVPLPDQD